MHNEVKQFIIDTLGLEDVSPEQIDVDAPLFGSGLGLDSVDALELGVALQKRYAIKLDPKDDSTKAHFASVASLAKLIEGKKDTAITLQ